MVFLFDLIPEPLKRERISHGKSNCGQNEGSGEGEGPGAQAGRDEGEGRCEDAGAAARKAA